MRADFAICAFFAYFLCETLAGIAYSKSNKNNSSTASESDLGTTNSSNTKKQEDTNESNAAAAGGSGEEAPKNKLSALLDTKKYLKQMPPALPSCAGGIKKSRSNRSSVASESDIGTNSGSLETKENSDESKAIVVVAADNGGEGLSRKKLTGLLDAKKYLKQIPLALTNWKGATKTTADEQTANNVDQSVQQKENNNDIDKNSMTSMLRTCFPVAQSVNTNFADLVDSKRKTPYMQTSYQQKSCSKNKHNDGSVRHRKIKPVKLLMNNPSADVEAEVVKRPSSLSRPILYTRRLEKGESSMSKYFDDYLRRSRSKNASFSSTSSSSSLAIIPFEQQKEQPNKATAEKKGKKVATLLDTKKRSKSFHSRFPPTAGPSQRESTRRPSLGDLLNARRKSEADLESMDTLWEPMNEGIFRF